VGHAACTPTVLKPSRHALLWASPAHGRARHNAGPNARPILHCVRDVRANNKSYLQDPRGSVHRAEWRGWSPAIAKSRSRQQKRWSLAGKCSTSNCRIFGVYGSAPWNPRSAPSTMFDDVRRHRHTAGRNQSSCVLQDVIEAIDLPLRLDPFFTEQFRKMFGARLGDVFIRISRPSNEQMMVCDRACRSRRPPRRL